MTPLIVRANPKDPSKRQVLVRFPCFRSCCRRDAEVRRRWWGQVDAALEAFRSRARVKGWEKVDVAKLAQDLAKRIPRPAAVTKRGPTPAPSVLVPSPPFQTAPCWTILGICPGSGAKAIKRALDERLERLRREGADLAAMKEVQAAALECLQRLATGIL